MRGGIAAILTVGLLASLATSAEAQSGQRGAGGALGGFSLITHPAVEKELKLDPTQVEKAKALSDEMKGKFEEAMGSLKTLPPRDQLKKLPSLAQAHYEEGMKALAGFLKPEQLDRFDQLLFQQRGAAAMLEPASVQALKLTEAQAKQVGSLIDAAKNRQRQVLQAAQQDEASSVPKLESIAREANTKALVVLSPEQKKAWRELTGEPFNPKAEGR